MVDCVTEIPLPGRTFAAGGCATADSAQRVTMPTFVAGPENRFVAATFERLLRAADDGVERPAATANLIALFGPSGVGKTHLARGLVRYWQQQRGEEAAFYTTAADLRRQITAAIAAHSVSELRCDLRRRDLLVIDDLHQLPPAGYLTQELRYTLDAYEESGGTVVVASTRPATSLANLPPDVRSRLAAGLLLQLAPPGAAARLTIINHASRVLSRPVSLSAAQRVAAAMSGQAPHLFALLFELSTAPHAEAENDVQQAEKLIAARARRRPTLRQITVAVAQHSRLPQKELKGSARRRSVVLARGLAIYLARELSGASYDQIGRSLGGRDHSTIMHNYRKIDRQRHRDPQIQESLDELRRILVGS